MKFSRAVWTVLSILLLPAIVAATTIHVPDDHTDIQAAVDAAFSGDTILVGEGIYRENIDFGGKDLVLKSEFGPELTYLRNGLTGDPVIWFHNAESRDAVVEGFTFSDVGLQENIYIDSAGPTIRGNHFTNLHLGSNRVGIFPRRYSWPVIERNLFYDNTDLYAAIWLDIDVDAVIANNSIDDVRTGMILWSDDATVINNTISNCYRLISNSSSALYNYNNIWNLPELDKANISVEPDFIDAAAGNFELMPNSQLIDQGDPSSAYDDPDGTRNDIGAIPFDQRAAGVYNLSVTEDPAHVTSTTPTLSWSFYDPVDAQISYEIEVGTDSDWAVAELWQPGLQAGNIGSVVYAGSPLSPGDIVHWRIRARNSSVWGAWKEHVFRVNEAPTAPAAIGPINAELVSSAGFRLEVDGAVSSFGDDLTYDFELYADPGLTSLVASQTGVTAVDPTAVSEKITGLTVGNSYWWRARADDSFEKGLWSATAELVIRHPMTFPVPAQYTTIQAAIDVAQELDTILLADGTYTGDGNRDLSFEGRNLVLASENGPDATTIDLAGQPEDPHYLLTVKSREDTTAVIEGLRVIDGDNEQFRGVVTVYNGGLKIRDCLFEDNAVPPVAVIFVSLFDTLGTVQVENSSFRQNDASAIEVGLDGDLRVTGCRFDSNAVHGIELYNARSAVITGNTFVGNNTGVSARTGGGIPNVVASNNTFSLNIVGFDSFIDLPKAGATMIDIDPRIEANVFAYNLNIGLLGYVGEGMDVTCNNSFGNGVEDYPESVGPGDAFGNISLDPRFCDAAAGEFSLATNSPCAPGNNSCGVLMGAFAVDPACESRCCVGLTGNVNQDPDGVVNLTDLTVLINNLFVTFQTLDCPAAANTSGDATCQINLTDITVLVNRLFVTFEPTAACIPACE